MNPEVKEKWLKALRCEYKQEEGRLKRGDTFCCLGVLSDLYIKEHDNCRWNSSDEFVQDDGYSVDDYLPEPVMIWAGLECNNPKVFSPENDQETTVVDLNDNCFSFEQIADVIEEQL